MPVLENDHFHKAAEFIEERLGLLRSKCAADVLERTVTPVLLDFSKRDEKYLMNYRYVMGFISLASKVERTTGTVRIPTFLKPAVYSPPDQPGLLPCEELVISDSEAPGLQGLEVGIHEVDTYLWGLMDVRQGYNPGKLDNRAIEALTQLSPGVEHEVDTLTGQYDRLVA